MPPTRDPQAPAPSTSRRGTTTLTTALLAVLCVLALAAPAPAPAEAASPRVVVIIHGGGWHQGSSSNLEVQVARSSLAAAGVRSKAINLAPGDPLIAEQSAVRQVQALRRAGWRVSVWGISSGGTIAERLAERRLVRRAVAVGPVSQLVAHADRWGLSDRWIGGRYWSRARLAAADPSLHLGRRAAPLVLVHGTDDWATPIAQSQWMAQRWPGPARLLTHRGSGHEVAYKSCASCARWLGER